MPAGTELTEVSRRSLDELAPSATKIAVCQYGPSVYARLGSFQGIDVLVVCDGYSEGLRAHRRVSDKREIRFLIAERNLLESDVKQGALGDFLTEKLLYPYHGIENSSYFEQLSYAARIRAVKEEARDLVLNYGELCRGLVVKPEFFGLSRLRRRARVFVPSMSDYLRLLETEVRNENLTYLHDSYLATVSGVRELEVEGDNVTITDGAVDRWLKGRASEQVVNILRESQRVFYSYLTRGRAIFLDLDLLARELYSPLRLNADSMRVTAEPEDPKNHLYLRTEAGMLPLNERFSIEEIASRLRPGRQVTVSPLAGVLNEVFLLTAGKEQFVAKKFTDWHGFKWFTLNLVSFGSKLFAVSGKTRMENEYGMNRFLAKNGIKVPQVVYASLKERTLVERYVPGVPLDKFVIKVVGQSLLSRDEYRLSHDLGDTLGRIHEVGVSMGDSKPENFVAEDGEIFAIDLEQAGRRGDYAWDIAELLFYSGHYSSTQTATRGLSEFVEAFIQGYLKRGRGKELKRAAGVRYAKVFSLWTPAPVILEITQKLRASNATQ